MKSNVLAFKLLAGSQWPSFEAESPASSFIFFMFILILIFFITICHDRLRDVSCLASLSNRAESEIDSNLACNCSSSANSSVPDVYLPMTLASLVVSCPEKLVHMSDIPQSSHQTLPSLIHCITECRGLCQCAPWGNNIQTCTSTHDGHFELISVLIYDKGLVFSLVQSPNMCSNTMWFMTSLTLLTLGIVHRRPLAEGILQG